MNDSESYEQVWSWMRILDATSYYELLGIQENAEQRSIQEAFHRFSESFHPDRHRGADEEIREGVTRIFRRGAEAYGVLRSPTKRALYDLGLAQGSLRLTQTQEANSKSLHASTNLSSTCKTPAGRLHARQIERAMSEADTNEARFLMQKVLMAEGKNTEFEELFNQLMQRIKRQ